MPPPETWEARLLSNLPPLARKDVNVCSCTSCVRKTPNPKSNGHRKPCCNEVKLRSTELKQIQARHVGSTNHSTELLSTNTYLAWSQKNTAGSGAKSGILPCDFLRLHTGFHRKCNLQHATWNINIKECKMQHLRLIGSGAKRTDTCCLSPGQQTLARSADFVFY